VLLDVVVTDGKNHPITGLQQEEFSLTEDGQPQRILYFEARTAGSAAAAANAPALPLASANTFRNVAAENSERPLNVLLYDLLNTPLTDQPFAHSEIVKFLHNRPPGSRFAIFVLGDRLRLLQGFSDDENQLVAAMQRKEARPRSTLLSQSVGGSPSATEQFSGPTFSGDASAQAMLGRLQGMEALTRRFFLERRVDRTMGAFLEIAKFLEGLPGRKNLIWLSGSFPLNIFPGADPLDAFAGSVSFDAALRQTADLLTVGQVAVYPVDIRGLTTDPFFDASNAATYRSPAEIAQAHRSFLLEIGAEQDAMDQIAEETGGHAFYNSNGLADAIATSIADGANYYSLSYAPSNAKFDGGLRKIRVHLTRRGYHLAYRHSYLADDSVLDQGANRDSMRLQVALRRGAPLAQEFFVHARLVPQGRSRPATKEEVARLAGFPAYDFRKKGARESIQRYAVDYVLDGSQISLEPAAHGARDGRLQARFEILIGAYDEENRTMFGYRSPQEELYVVKSADDATQKPIRLRHVVELPADAAWLRVAVRDAIGDRLGSVEISLPIPVKLSGKANDTSR
jgi:VWFA-related protein